MRNLAEIAFSKYLTLFRRFPGPGGHQPASEITELSFSHVHMRIIRYWPRFLGRDNTGTARNRISRGTPPNLSLQLQPHFWQQSHSKEFVTNISMDLEPQPRLLDRLLQSRS